MSLSLCTGGQEGQEGRDGQGRQEGQEGQEGREGQEGSAWLDEEAIGRLQRQHT